MSELVDIAAAFRRDWDGIYYSRSVPFDTPNWIFSVIVMRNLDKLEVRLMEGPAFGPTYQVNVFTINASNREDIATWLEEQYARSLALCGLESP